MIAEHFSTIFKVQTDEVETVARVGMLFAVIEAGRAIGWNTGDVLLFQHDGFASLPYLYILMGVVSGLVGLAFSSCLGTVDKRRFFTIVFIAMVIVLIVERVMMLSRLVSIYLVSWLTVNLYGVLAATLTWSVAGLVTHASQTKRLFPLYASSGILGAIAGNLVTGPFENILGTENLMVVYAALLLVGLWLNRVVAQGFPDQPTKPKAQSSRRVSSFAGYGIVRESKLLQMVALSTVLVSTLYFSFSFSFSQIISRSFTTEAEMASFLGRTSAVVTTVIFLVSLLVTNRLFARFGAVNSALIMPLTYLVGFALIAMEPSLSAAVTARVAQMAGHVGIGVTAFNSLFDRISEEQRSQALSFNASVPKQIGTILSGLLLVLGEHALDLTRVLVLAGILLSLACTLIILQMRKQYAVEHATA